MQFIRLDTKMSVLKTKTKLWMLAAWEYWKIIRLVFEDEQIIENAIILICQQYSEKTIKSYYRYFIGLAKWNKKTMLYKLIDIEYKVEISWCRVQMARVTFLSIKPAFKSYFRWCKFEWWGWNKNELFFFYLIFKICGCFHNDY